MNPQEIEILLQQGEGYNLEFKEGYSKTIAEEVCAFLNSTGGTLIIGVKDDNSVCGTDFDNSRRSQLQQSIDAINPRPSVSIQEIKYGEKKLVVIECGTGSQKPYIFSGSIFIRNGANTQKLTSAEEMRDFFQQQLKVFFDESPCFSLNYPDDFDSIQFSAFLKDALITTSLPEKAFLQNLKMFTEDEKVKNGAALFFAKDVNKHFEHATLRCLLFKGNDKRYIIDDKEFRGNLINQFHEAINYIKSKLELRYEIESQGSGPRKEILEIPEIVFKEAIINALAHRDYYEKGAKIHIEIFDNRVEISNPGGLVSAISLKDFGKKSISRNPLIFGLFHRLHLVEQAGTGIQRMRDVMKENNLPEPIFSTEGMFTVTLYRPVDFDRWIEKQGSKLTENQTKILKAIRANKEVTIKALAPIIGISETAIENNIQKLKSLNVLNRIGSDKEGRWDIYFPELQ